MNGGITTLLGAGCLLVWTTFLRADQTHLRCYLDFQEGKNLRAKGEFLGALVDFEGVLAQLQTLHRKDPDWESDLVVRKMKDCQDEIQTLRAKAEREVLASGSNSATRAAPLTGIFLEAERFENERNFLIALKRFEKYQTMLRIIHNADPGWEVNWVRLKQERVQARILGVESAWELQQQAQRGLPGQDNTIQ